jgi:hypothetical protein
MNNPLSYIDEFGLYKCVVDGVETDCKGSAPGGGGGGGLPVFISGTCWTQLPNNDGGSSGYYQGSACTVFAGYWNPSGGGAGAGGGFFSRLRSKICSAIPQGNTTGVNYGLGIVAGGTGSAEIVVNYNTGQVSGFTSYGVQAGLTGGAQGSVFSGFIYGPLQGNNSGYSNGFTSGTYSWSAFGIFGSASSGGVAGNPLAFVPGGVKVGGVSIGGNLLGVTPNGSLSATQYSQPLQLGKYWAFSPLDWALYGARQVCK